MTIVIRRAAELLKEGAVMLPETCPICGSPLYKLRDGRIVCPVHGEIMKIKSKKQETEIKVDTALDDLINAMILKVREFTSKVPTASKPDAEELSVWLRNLDLIIEIRNKLKIER